VTIVVDSSVALTWCFEDERRPETDAIGRKIAIEGTLVPALFHIEVANVLITAERKRRLADGEAARRMEQLGLLSIVVDEDTVAQAWTGTARLAQQERLTTYDASYLELALRTGSDLATLDADLIAAARRRGVTVLP
jgi:predicted nucleic acid-binding protein